MKVEEVNKFAGRVFKLAGKFPLQVFIRIKKGILVRFANNGVHQNGFQDLFSYTVRALTQDGPVYLESNDVSDAGIRNILDRVHLLARHSEPLPKLKKRSYVQKKEYFPLQVSKTPEMASRAIAEGLSLIRRQQASANGYYSAYERFFYLANSEGLELSHQAAAVRFGVTITKGAGKGYLSFFHPDPKKLKVTPIVGEAMNLAEDASHDEILLTPGEYECVFSPRAFLELIDPLRRHFDARLTQDGKSVFTGALGKKIFSEAFTLEENIEHPRQFGVPFDAEGSPRRRVTLINKGTLKELLAEGHSTRSLSEHPFNPQNLIVKEGNLSQKAIFKKIKRGIFINKIWYHTLVKESSMEVTGLATAGSIYIEDGSIRGRVIHLRYHDSLFSILRSVVGTSKEQILLKDGEMGAALFPYIWVSRLKVV
ncbi:MAG: TldD/PmbA family protein [Candidatus Omnitrophica bacterium]|nr:TldD/PmbA family protein [Candidatus Omnitrophota bacterium]